ncbi:hypothetical protein LBMAG56_20010 [Verrucomicrobiota bacterium]|nr:hypothetical protein LBMAG56_20010 [Verrucomicrobiota bacterium]
MLATLATGLRSVAAVAKRFAAPPKSSAEAELAGLLHDLGKYAQRFQARLQDNFIHGNNDWGAGAARAAELRCHTSAFAVDGHYSGIAPRNGNGLTADHRPDALGCGAGRLRHVC